MQNLTFLNQLTDISKLHNKFSILRMMPDLLSIFRYMKKNEERFGMEINMRDLMKVAKA